MLVRVFLILTALFVGQQIIATDAAKILCAFPSPSKSHMVIASAFMKGLAEKGHKVTVLGSFPLEKPVKNYRDVYVKIDDIHQEFVADLMAQKVNFFAGFFKIFDLGLNAANKSLHSPEFQKIMKEESFDLVIIGMFTNNFLVGLAAHFKCPLVVLTTVPAIGLSNSMVANPTAMATVPHMMLGDIPKMDFSHRVKNFFFILIEKIFLYFLQFKENRYYEANFPKGKYPTYDQMFKNISLVFVNHHFSEGIPRPYVPAMVEIGGIQIKSKPDPLPEKIQTFLDSAENGAIFFSLGSNLKSSLLPPERLDAILTSFSKMKQKVLFKWETDTLPNKPKNMMVGKWLPQDDILAHKNIKLFVTHGGISSICEAKYHGIPIVGIPIFGDQLVNIESASNEGWATYVELGNVTEKTLSNAIKEVLTNSRYTNTVRKLSSLYKDRPLTAMDTAIYWTEYVIRHHGARHLQSPGVYQNFFVRNSLDVIAFIILTILVCIKLGGSFLFIAFGNLKEKFCKNSKETEHHEKTH